MSAGRSILAGWLSEQLRLRILTCAVVFGSTVGLMAVGSPASAVGPPPKPYLVAAQDDGGGHCIIEPYSGPVAPFDPLGEWKNFFGTTVTVTEENGFWLFDVPPVPDGPVYREIRNAGTYREDCGGAGTDLPVRLHAPPEAGPSFIVRWATNAAATLGHSVQYRIGAGAVHQWKADTTAKWATFNGSHNHRYYFRALTIKDATHRSAYSPWSQVIVH